jgi:hypothetical protein
MFHTSCACCQPRCYLPLQRPTPGDGGQRTARCQPGVGCHSRHRRRRAQRPSRSKGGCLQPPSLAGAGGQSSGCLLRMRQDLGQGLGRGPLWQRRQRLQHQQRRRQQPRAHRRRWGQRGRQRDRDRQPQRLRRAVAVGRAGVQRPNGAALQRFRQPLAAEQRAPQPQEVQPALAFSSPCRLLCHAPRAVVTFSARRQYVAVLQPSQASSASVQGTDNISCVIAGGWQTGSPPSACGSAAAWSSTPCRPRC